MPKTSVAAPDPGTARPIVSTETTATLAKKIEAGGLCRPQAGAMKTRYQVDGESDPWFPVIESGPRAVDLAREACSGCPVKGACLELALRQEQTLGDVWGVRGGLSAGERRRIVRARMLVTSVLEPQR